MPGFGEESIKVAELQKALNLMGFKCPVDGLFAEDTLRAVKKYQMKRFVTGYVSDTLMEDILNKQAKIVEESTAEFEEDTEIAYELEGQIYFTNEIENFDKPEFNRTKRKGFPIDTIIFLITEMTSSQEAFKGYHNKFGTPPHYFISDTSVISLLPHKDASWRAAGCFHKDGVGMLAQRSLIVEIQNWGELEQKAEGKFYHKTTKEPYNIEILGQPIFINETHWAPFNNFQIGAAVAIARKMVETNNVRYLVRFSDVAINRHTLEPWSTNPGPIFPIDFIKTLAFSASIENKTGL